MNEREAAELLTLMRGTWPKLAVEEVANRLWLDDLLKLDSKLALETFRNLRDDWAEARVPSWANFLATYRQKAKVYADRPRREVGTGDDYRPPTQADKDRLHAMIVELKDKLQLAGQRKARRTPVERPVPDGPREELSYDELYAEQDTAF